MLNKLFFSQVLESCVLCACLCCSPSFCSASCLLQVCQQLTSEITQAWLDIVIYSNSDMMGKVWTLFHTSFYLCLVWQEQRRATQPAGGRNGAHPTGACGRQTFLAGWKSCELGQLTRGCRTWLVPSGLTSPLATSWATIPLTLNLNLRSEAKERRGAEI